MKRWIGIWRLGSAKAKRSQRAGGHDKNPKNEGEASRRTLDSLMKKVKPSKPRSSG